jgi:hypothetical protein
MEDSNPKKEEAETELKINESTESINNTPKVNCKKMKSKILILKF